MVKLEPLDVGGFGVADSVSLESLKTVLKPRTVLNLFFEEEACDWLGGSAWATLVIRNRD